MSESGAETLLKKDSRRDEVSASGHMKGSRQEVMSLPLVQLKLKLLTEWDWGNLSYSVTFGRTSWLLDDSDHFESDGLRELYLKQIQGLKGLQYVNIVGFQKIL